MKAKPILIVLACAAALAGCTSYPCAEPDLPFYKYEAVTLKEGQSLRPKGFDDVGFTRLDAPRAQSVAELKELVRCSPQAYLKVWYSGYADPSFIPPNQREVTLQRDLYAYTMYVGHFELGYDDTGLQLFDSYPAQKRMFHAEEETYRYKIPAGTPITLKKAYLCFNWVEDLRNNKFYWLRSSIMYYISFKHPQTGKVQEARYRLAPPPLKGGKYMELKSIRTDEEWQNWKEWQKRIDEADITFMQSPYLPRAPWEGEEVAARRPFPFSPTRLSDDADLDKTKGCTGSYNQTYYVISTQTYPLNKK